MTPNDVASVAASGAALTRPQKRQRGGRLRHRVSGLVQRKSEGLRAFAQSLSTAGLGKLLDGRGYMADNFTVCPVLTVAEWIPRFDNCPNYTTACID